MNIDSFIRWERLSRDAIDVKRCYIDIAGDLVAGILLSQIIYWHLPDKNGKTKLTVEREGYLWLAKKREEWWDEVRISAKQFDRAITVLEDIGVVETRVWKYKENLAKHIRLNWDAVIKKLDTLSNLDFDQRSNYNLPSEEYDDLIYPKVKLEINQKSNSNLTKGEKHNIDTENTTENTTKKKESPFFEENKENELIVPQLVPEVEFTQDTSSSLFNKPESSQQNELTNPDQYSGELALKTSVYIQHPAYKMEERFKNPQLPPWMIKAGPNGFDPSFVEKYQEHLSLTPHYAKELKRKATVAEAKKRLVNLSQTEAGRAEIHLIWDHFEEIERDRSYKQNQVEKARSLPDELTQPKTPLNIRRSKTAI
ncbi:hypothetical protein PCC6912_40220 [Chlorogloeopsis fritschii PCC 6912]|uniref:Uncharacterized protein n=1 Tax=Chlorogloeopsis fritschii PCC 6912 TaxID=211165 RepID=A0A3S0ZPW7_CHLFR|nr:hypothetical protein [Chlorogloeopsis fritschii]RUR77063.1 hypothetical protein PCC6912_40220 [Chlorogloeopsis fritschii PCC 6912]